MDNKDFDDEIDELEDETPSYEEIPEEEIESENQDFYTQNINNQIRNIRRENKGSQNTVNRLRQRNANTIVKKATIPNQNTDEEEQSEQKQNKLDKLNSLKQNGGLSNIGNGLKEKGKEIGTAAKEKAKQAIVSGTKKIAAFLLKNPYVLIIIGVLILIIIIPVLWKANGDEDDSSGNLDNSEIISNSDSMISLKRTKLSRQEFVDACNNYSNSSKHKAFYDKCGRIYDISKENNFNPEMVVIRAIVEGFSPGEYKNNYWGIGCFNGAGSSACKTYGSFDEGVKAYIKNVSQYETVEQMASKYAYIGDNWYNPGGSASGGCYYFPYIKQYMSSARIITVQNACSESKKCSGTICIPTNDEDQMAYAKYQVSKMVDVGNSVFGSVTSQEATSKASSSKMPTSVEDLKIRYYFTFDKEKYLKLEGADSHLFGQCVWYAYHRAMDIVNSSNLSSEEKQKRIESLQSHSSDGGAYVTAMEGSIFKKTTNPNDIKAPAVISWKNGSYGHVAIIEEVQTDSNGNKTFVVSEGWRNRDCPNRSWCTHNSIESLWAVTRFNSYTTSSVNTYSSGYTFVNAASLLE